VLFDGFGFERVCLAVATSFIWPVDWFFLVAIYCVPSLPFSSVLTVITARLSHIHQSLHFVQLHASGGTPGVRRSRRVQYVLERLEFAATSVFGGIYIGEEWV
jgi:hypothetical protein